MGETVSSWVKETHYNTFPFSFTSPANWQVELQQGSQDGYRFCTRGLSWDRAAYIFHSGEIVPGLEVPFQSLR